MIATPTRSSFRYFALCAALFVLFENLPSFAQDRCGTVEYSDKLFQRKNVLETPQQFEQWLKTRRLSKDGAGHRPMTATYQIPVVVHVIHNGETVGNGTNISNAQILSQIATLNRDYQRQNTDKTSTPAEFAAVAGSLDIEFVLAKQDPEGLTTTGIVRMQGPKTAWTINDNYQLKALSYWPAEDYLNMWVCNLTDYLGYAQLPVSTLPGLENSSNNRLSDGVVIAYSAFGSVEDGTFPVLDPQYNRGRTATHEIGHFFGLRHIWGDDNNACGNVGDYVDDTPDQAGRTFNCPTHPAISCPGINKMFQNYMDYTDDQCMNLFTALQVDRMVTVIENSPRRVTLPTSHGLVTPAPVADDAGIKGIVSPETTSCSATVSPTLEIRNYGNNNVTSVTVQLKVNSNVQETKTVSVGPVAVGLAPLETEIITFNDVIISPGLADFTFTITQTNGGADGNAANNTETIQTVTPTTLAVPFTESFNTQPADWTIDDPDNFLPWTLTTAPNSSPTNKAMFMNFFAYEDGEGEIDILTTPVMDLSNQTLAVLYFDVAYAPFNGSTDGLKVYVLTDCDESIYDGTLIYNKSGTTLGTTAAISTAFVPGSSTDWRKEAINLASFIGQEHVQLAFVGLNDWGNNLYLDNVAVLTSEYEDITLMSVTPGLITCKTSPSFKLTVRNSGTLPINSFDIRLQGNGQSVYHKSLTLDVPLAPGSSYTATLEPYTLIQGVNTIALDLSAPNGQPDVNENDNHLDVSLTVNNNRFTIPYRESFESGFTGDWTLLSPTGGMLWQTQTNLKLFGTSAYYNAFDNTTAGDETWLISPVFDFTLATEASLQFYSSYAVNGTHKDRLRVLYSADCGNTFQAVPFFDKSGDGLSTKKSTSEWTPQELGDWQHRVLDLSALAGADDLRFAFVASNDHGNDLYLDNINFSTTVEPNPLLNEQLYVIYQKKDEFDFYFTFNLPEKQMVQYEVIDAMGRRVVHGAIPDVLNQTYPVSLGSSTAEGVYIVRLGIGTRYYSTKLFVAK